MRDTIDNQIYFAELPRLAQFDDLINDSNFYSNL